MADFQKRLPIISKISHKTLRTTSLLSQQPPPMYWSHRLTQLVGFTLFYYMSLMCNVLLDPLCLCSFDLSWCFPPVSAYDCIFAHTTQSLFLLGMFFFFLCSHYLKKYISSFKEYISKCFVKAAVSGCSGGWGPKHRRDLVAETSNI